MAGLSRAMACLLLTVSRAIPPHGAGLTGNKASQSPDRRMWPNGFGARSWLEVGRSNDARLKMARNAQTMRPKPGLHGNLAHRPAKPALYNGRLQKACQRAFIALNGPISTGDAAQWCYPWADRPDYGHVKRALKSIGAVKLRRLGGSARPLLWAPPSI